MCNEQCCNKYCRVRAKRESVRQMASTSDYTLFEYIKLYLGIPVNKQQFLILQFLRLTSSLEWPSTKKP